MKGLFLVCICLTLLLASSCKREEVLTESEVTAAIERFDLAWLKKNKPQVDSILAPSYIYFTQSGGIFSRDSVVATSGSPTYQLENMERSGLVIQIHGNTAVVSTRWKGKGLYRGQTFDLEQRCSVIVLKYKGKVQILSEHCAPIIQVNSFN